MVSIPARKVLLVGWDSADWKVINPLLDAGKLPHLEQLINGGIIGNLATLYPILSPMLWTSIATGKRPMKHGIHGFAEPDPHTGGVRPITNLSRKTKAVWNILSQSGKKCIVVGWWPSSPAEPLVDGVTVSNHYQRAPHNDPAQPWPLPPGTVHPARLAEILAELRVHPGELDGAHVLPFVPKAAEIDQKKDRRLEGLAKTIADCTSIHAAASHLIRNEPWDFMAVYYDAIDHFGHGFMRYHPPRQKQVSEKDFELYSGVIEAGYRYHDMMLGILMAMAGPETTVLLMSDHGFHPDHLRPAANPMEPAGPAVEHRHYGILALRGPGLKKDERIYGATVLDICPTLLALFGLPVGQDMDGKPLVTAFADPPKIETVPTWDAVPGADGSHPPGTKLDAGDAKEAIKQLEALGYIQPLPDDAEKAVAETDRELRYNLACAHTDANQHAAAAGLFAALWGERADEHFLLAHRRLSLIYANRLKDPEKSAEHREKFRRGVERLKAQRSAAASAPAPKPAPPPSADAEPAREFGPAFDPAQLAPARADAAYSLIVSGLPRSGTSLMMQMLEAGGVPALHDRHRPADDDNPRGYFEFAPAKNIRADASWLPHSKGRALKLVAQLLPFLPPGQEYRIIFMERALEEVLASQKVMLDRHGRRGAALAPEKLRTVYEQQLARVSEILERRKLPVLRVAHADAVRDPAATALRVAEFLALPLDRAAMATAVDPRLHRQRTTK